jgi:hypothetical protein
VGEAVGEHAADAVNVDDRLVGPLLRLRRRRVLRLPRERSHRTGFRAGASKGYGTDGLRPPADVEEERLDARAGLCSASDLAWCGAARV